MQLLLTKKLEKMLLISRGLGQQQLTASAALLGDSHGFPGRASLLGLRGNRAEGDPYDEDRGARRRT